MAITSGSTRTFLTSFLAFLMVAGMAFSPAQLPRVSAQDAVSSIADAVPADTVMYMDVELDQDSDQVTQAFDLLDRSGLSALMAEETDMTPEQAADSADQADINGQVAVVFTDAASLVNQGMMTNMTNTAMDTTLDPSTATQQVPDGFALVFAADDPEAMHGKMVDMVTNEAGNQDATVQTTTYNDVEITYWESTDPAVEPSATALVGDYVILTVRPTGAEGIIDTVNGDLEPLSGDASFQAVTSALDTDALVFGYLNLSVALDAALEADPANAQNAAQLEESRGQIGWNVYAADDGFHADTVMIPEDPTIIDQQSTFDPTAATRTPADSLFMMNANDLSSSGLSDSVGMLLQIAMSPSGMPGTPTAQPAATPTIDDAFAMLEGQLGFNLKTDLIDHLDGEYTASGQISNLTTAPEINVVWASQTSDPTAVADTLDKVTYITNSLAKDMNAEVGTRSVDGGELTTVTVPDALGPGMPVVVEYGVVGDEMLIGVNDGVDNYLNGSAAPLADDAAYQQTLEALPQDNIVSVSYLNMGQLLPLIDEMNAMSDSSASSVQDNDPACGEYDTQEEAQAAYDADTSDLWNLDMNFDGTACEDYFSTGTEPEASPVSMTESLNIISIGSVTSVDGNMIRTNSVMLIGE